MAALVGGKFTLQKPQSRYVVPRGAFLKTPVASTPESADSLVSRLVPDYEEIVSNGINAVPSVNPNFAFTVVLSDEYDKTE
jgi:hypothetical protein